MTAKEKFEARLRELGIYDEWDRNGFAGAETDKEIVVLVHYDYGKNDPYTEFHYPRFDAMSQDQIDTLSAHFANEYFNPDPKKEAKFFSELLKWCTGKGKCPLFPCDVYTNLQETEWFQFEDDADNKEEARYQEELREHIGAVQIITTSLGYFRHKLLDAILHELERGHNIDEKFNPHPGWDNNQLYGYYVEGYEWKVAVNDKGLLVIHCEGEGERNAFDIPLYAEDFPIEVLINIFEYMK